MKAKPAPIYSNSKGPEVTIDTPLWAWKFKTGVLIAQEGSNATVAFEETDSNGRVTILRVKFPANQVIINGKQLEPPN